MPIRCLYHRKERASVFLSNILLRPAFGFTITDHFHELPATGKDRPRFVSHNVHYVSLGTMLNGITDTDKLFTSHFLPPLAVRNVTSRLFRPTLLLDVIISLVEFLQEGALKLTNRNTDNYLR